MKRIFQPFGKLYQLFLIVVCGLDEMFIRLYEIGIGDPLQAHGVSLFKQFNCVAVLSLAALIVDLFLVRQRWIGWGADALGVVTWAGIYWPYSVALRRQRLEPPPQDTIGFNPMRYIFSLRLGRLLLLFMMAPCLGIRILYQHMPLPYDYALALYVLSWFIDACQPKPPRPKREKLGRRMVLATVKSSV